MNLQNTQKRKQEVEEQKRVWFHRSQSKHFKEEVVNSVKCTMPRNSSKMPENYPWGLDNGWSLVKTDDAFFLEWLRHNRNSMALEECESNLREHWLVLKKESRDGSDTRRRPSIKVLSLAVIVSFSFCPFFSGLCGRNLICFCLSKNWVKRGADDKDELICMVEQVSESGLRD